jgi:hypothetical protein
MKKIVQCRNCGEIQEESHQCRVCTIGSEFFDHHSIAEDNNTSTKKTSEKQHLKCGNCGEPNPVGLPECPHCTLPNNVYSSNNLKAVHTIHNLSSPAINVKVPLLWRG